MADDTKKLKAECERLTAENATLKEEVERLKDELVRLVSRNLDLSERLEEDVEMRRRVEVARELLDGNIQRQRNADLQDDGQLMAMIELKVEKDLPHLSPDFDSNALAELLGVSHERLVRLFRHQTIHRTPDAYIDNLRVLQALRLLREKPLYNIATIATEAGFSNVRTLQRRVQDVIGMSPVDYRVMLTRDIK
ncbi:MAG: helix-turn-helix domain-containing protein [Bacteroidaceae bacterium]|jgi:transcriptional regulator GlxA family with amidase domain|nr:helix-turn-helix domain-containing protein [Bacteroidaceae bacterium]MBO7660271.1 helix-turn-helix domain-containing protein [Bacteroidaceae bacterium]MBQ1666196.1 helix-turn-helix domain-containing protein [Bacteroidaceae bacterium]MBQ2165600.1 helix-turn-helix domain-containing protein [Bacteroidaceae bacterium]MBQ2180955.1 helix-turn-helix domain-containing protein [Bacteroidaceae bacterium]